MKAENLEAEFRAIEAELDAGKSIEEVTAPRATQEPETTDDAAPEEGDETEPTEPTEETANEEDQAEGDEGQQTEGLLAKLPSDRESRVKLLNELATALGYHVDGNQVAVQERIKWRQEKQQEKAAIRQAREALEADRAQLASLAGKAEKAVELFNDGEPEEALRLLFGKGLDEANKLEVEKLRGKDPRVTKLERQLREKEEREQKLLQEQREREHTEQRRAAHQAYADRLAGAFKQHKEFSALAEFPELIERVIELQIRNQDPDDGSTITAEEAARYVVEEERERHTKRSKLFGAQATSTPETSSEVAPRDGSVPAKRAVKHRTVPQSKASRASGQSRTLSDSEFYKVGAQALEKAWAAELAAKSGG